MNHQTKRIMNEAIAKLNDEGVFSADQIALLQVTVDRIADAIDMESKCISCGINHSG